MMFLEAICSINTKYYSINLKHFVCLIVKVGVGIVTWVFYSKRSLLSQIFFFLRQKQGGGVEIEGFFKDSVEFIGPFYSLSVEKP